MSHSPWCAIRSIIAAASSENVSPHRPKGILEVVMTGFCLSREAIN